MNNYSQKRIAKNTIMLYIRMLILMAVSLYTSRVILKTLGIDDYGIYNLIAGFITIFSFISASLIASLQRFFSVALGQGDNSNYIAQYSMGYNIFIIFSLILLVFGETVGLWFVSTQLNIPDGREIASLWVYHTSLICMVLSMLRTPDNASIIAHEKMNFYAYISIIEALLKLLIVFVLSLVNMDKLILYVVLYLLTTLFINFIYSYYCRKQINVCRYKLVWDKKLFKEMVAFSGWNMVTGGAQVVKNQGENIFINHFYSVAVNAAFGVASQVYNAVNLFLTNFQTAFRPQLIQSYASDDMDVHYKLLFRSAKFSYYLLLIIVIPVFFNLNELLGLWLEEVPKYTSEFCKIILVTYLIDSFGFPLAISVSANGNIKGIQLFSSVSLLIGLVASYLFLKAGYLPYVVAYVTLAVHVFFVFCYLFYAHKLCAVSYADYLKRVIVPITFVTIVAAIVPALVSTLMIDGWRVLISCVLEFIITSLLIYYMGLEKEEKKYVENIIKSRLAYKI